MARELCRVRPGLGFGGLAILCHGCSIRRLPGYKGESKLLTRYRIFFYHTVNPKLTGASVKMATMTLSAALAQMALSDHLVRKLKDANIVTGSDDTLPARSFTSPNEVKGLTGPLVPTDEKICIVGAGACGLYLALMLRYLGFSNFDVLESSQRVGGRCYTHKFTDDPQCPHNYYDIGAMRIPKIDAMKR